MIQVRMAAVLLAASLATVAAADDKAKQEKWDRVLAKEKEKFAAWQDKEAEKTRRKSQEKIARSKRPEERAEAAAQLGSFADAQTLALLTAALDDPDALVRENAARSLWKLHETSASAMDALRARLDDIPPVAVEAAGALEAMGVPAAELVPVRQRALERGNPWVRYLAARALLGEVPAGELFPALMDRYVADADSDRLGPVEAHAADQRRRDTIESLEVVAKNQDRSLIPPLMESLQRMAPGRAALLRLLARYQPPPDGWAELLGSLVSASDPKLQEEATTQLGRLRSEPEVEDWMPAVGRQLRSAKLRRNAMRTLAGAGSLAHAYAAPIAELLKDADGGVREDAAEALGKIGDRTQPGAQAIKREVAKVARGPLEAALTDPTRDVRRAAARALNLLQLEPADVTAVLARAATRPQEENLVRQSILIGLRNRGGEAKAAVPILEAYLPQAGDQKDLVEAALESIRRGKVHEPTLAPAAALDPEAEKRAHSYLRARGVAFEQTQFMKALNESDLQVVSAFLDAGMKANQPLGEYKEWPLISVLRWGPCDPNVRPTPDHLRETIELLIASGADVKQPDTVGITPLMHASSEGCDRVVMRTLIKAGARLADRDSNQLDAFEHGLLWAHDGLDELLAAGYRVPAARAKELLTWYPDNQKAMNYIRRASAPAAGRPAARTAKKPAP